MWIGARQPTTRLQTRGRTFRSTSNFGDPYSSGFDLTENPISEGGVWTNGGATGGSWQNVQTGSSHAYGVAVSAGYDDCLATLQGHFDSQTHFSEATCYKLGGYSPSGAASHESEILLGFTITSGVAAGYEITHGFGTDPQFVRWNGALGDFTVLSPTGTGVSGGIVDGDVMKATYSISGGNPVITLYRNGSQVYTYTDSAAGKIVSGSPGIGFFGRSGATMSSYCWASVRLGSGAG